MTFEEIYNIVSPAEDQSAWDANEQRHVIAVAETTRSIDHLLDEMKLFSTDWTKRARNQMAEKLWGEKP